MIFFFFFFFDNLFKPEKLELKTFWLMRKTIKITRKVFTQSVQEKSIKMLRLYFPKLIGKIYRHEGKNICA